MTRAILVLVQLLVPLFPVGLCTCPRSESTRTSKSTACRCGCCEHCHDSVPLTTTSPHPHPCPEPTCPAHPSFAKSEPGLPNVPVLIPSPNSALSALEPAATESKLVRHGTQDSIFLPTVQIFLVYGVMLI